MAKFELSGIDSLYKKLESMSKKSDGIKDKIVREAAEIVLSEQKRIAKSIFEGTGEGANALSIVNVRSDKGYSFMDIGINSENWEETKGLYFQHYGFFNVKANRAIAPTLWMDQATKKSKSKVTKLLKDKIAKELLR